MPDRAHAPLWQNGHRAKPFQLTHKQRNAPRIAKLDQISRVYNYKNGARIVGVGEPSKRHRLTEGTGE